MGAIQDWSSIEGALNKELLVRKEFLLSNGHTLESYKELVSATSNWIKSMKNAEMAGGLSNEVAEAIASQRDTLLKATGLENQTINATINSLKQATATPSLHLQTLAEWNSIKLGLADSTAKFEEHYLANNAINKTQYRKTGEQLADWLTRMEQAEVSTTTSAEMRSALAEERLQLARELNNGENMVVSVDASIARAATFNHAPLEPLLPSLEKQAIAETAAASGAMRGLAGPIGYALLLPEVALLVKEQYDKMTKNADSPAVKAQQDYVTQYGVSHANDLQP